MAWTIANECRKAALDGIIGLLSGGNSLLSTSGDVELAVLPISWAAASTASPSTSAGTVTADTSVTAGTIAKIAFRTSGNAVRINGSVGVGSGDFQVTDNVVPSGATEVKSTGGFTMSLQLS